MTMTRRDFMQRTGALAALGALGVNPLRALAQGSIPGGAPHYMILITLRGGFDSVLSLNPQDEHHVKDKVFLGYQGNERIQGSRRLYGPYIGGLERHDEDLCLVHGVRSDTTSHPDGLAILARGHRRARPQKIAGVLGGLLAGDAPLRNLNLISPDGNPVVAEGETPSWHHIRKEAHLLQARALGNETQQSQLVAGIEKSHHLSRFLAEANQDAAALDRKFRGDLAENLRLAFQAVRGNWARCIQVASRALWYDSHSDNLRFQEKRQPGTWADIAALLDLLKSTRNEHGRLLDQTTVAVFSEFGRFPRLNGEEGKDHFPENSWLLAGRGIRGGLTVGQTDPVGKGVAVDFRTGTAGGDMTRPIFVENTFATLVAAAGGNPTTHGYDNHSELSCIVAGHKGDQS